MSNVSNYMSELADTLKRLPWDEIDRAIEALQHARIKDNQVFILGNGGSAATASHFGCDLSKGTIAPDAQRFRVIALTDSMPLFSAWANDFGYDSVFAEQLTNLVRKGDVVIGISGSGNSPNVLNAMRVAREACATTIGFSGFGGGQLNALVDIPVVVPSTEMGQIEDIHLILEHAICYSLRQQSAVHSELASLGTEVESLGQPYLVLGTSDQARI